MKDVTLLIAHPDDEALFAWPVLERVKRIVCASNDAFNPERAWCAERGECMRDVAKLLGCEIVMHSNNSEFYRSQTRNGALKLIASDLAYAIGNPLVLFTHNAWGEYGNLDHILCHHIARTVQAWTGCQLLVSDIAQEINWLPITAWKQGALVPAVSNCPDEYREEHQIDRDLFDRIKGIYDARGCWTWSWPPQERARVYSV